MTEDGNRQPTMVFEVPRAKNGRIVGVEGRLKGQHWVITRTPFVLGRLPGSDINLDKEVGTSRIHAEIYSEGPYYTIVDLSSNGTMINGVQIPKGVVHPLHDEDIITICTLSFKFKFTQSFLGAAEPTDTFDVRSFRASEEMQALGAMEALAHAARLEAEAAKAKADAETELARVRAEAEEAKQESLRSRASEQELHEARAKIEAEARAALEAELARMRQRVEEEVRARAQVEIEARLRAETEARIAAERARAAAEAEMRARAEFESRALAEREELERLRAEHLRLTSAVKAAAAPAPQEPPSGGMGGLRTTPDNAAYRFNVNDDVVLVLSADNLRGETICTPARLVRIEPDGQLTLHCVEPVSPSRWLNRVVMIGKSPEKGNLPVAETRILTIESGSSNTVKLSNTIGPIGSVQLRSSVRQLAIPEVQTFSRADGKPSRLVDYSIGGVGIAVPRSEPHRRGDIIVGTLRLKRSLVFDVTLEVRGRHPTIDRPDEEDMLNCRFSTREMDPEVLRSISMAVLYRR